MGIAESIVAYKSFMSAVFAAHDDKEAKSGPLTTSLEVLAPVRRYERMKTAIEDVLGQNSIPRKELFNNGISRPCRT
jgi:hypothetical protein